MKKNEMINELRNRNNTNVSNLADSTVSRRFSKEDLEGFLLQDLDWHEAVALNLIDEETLRKGEENSLQALTASGNEVVFEAYLPPAELPGFSVIESWDKEREHFAGYDVGDMGEPVPVWDDSASATDDPYFTLSGTMQELGANDLIPVNTWINSFSCPNTKKFYSAAKPIQWRKQWRNFETIMSFIHKNKDNKELLQRGWKRFWKLVYAHAAKKDTSSWLWQKQIKKIRASFEANGIRAASK